MALCEVLKGAFAKEIQGFAKKGQAKIRLIPNGMEENGTAFKLKEIALLAIIKRKKNKTTNQNSLYVLCYQHWNDDKDELQAVCPRAW